MTDQPTTGYCPCCGRGDLAPTAEAYEQQRQRAEQAEAELARLRAGEEDGYDPLAEPTPGQWIARFNRATPQERHDAAKFALDNAARAGRCFMMAHEKRLEEDRHARVAVARVEQAEAAVARVRDLHSNANGICRWCKGPDDPNTSWDMEYWPCATLDDAPPPEFGNSNGSWHWWCNGGQGCDGWVGLELSTEEQARREYARHFEQEHLAQPAPKEG